MFSDSMMLGGGRKAAFSIANSVCLDGAADYFTRTPVVAGNRKKWTFSTWAKLSDVSGTTQAFLHARGAGGNNEAQILLNSAGKIQITSITGGAYDFGAPGLQTEAVFRDPSSFGHLCVVADIANATASERIKVYWNGIRQTLTGAQPDQTLQMHVDNAYPHMIGAGMNPAGTPSFWFFNGYLAETLLIDGAALEPTAFGEVDVVTGSWKPKKPVLGGRSDYINQITGAETYSSSSGIAASAADGNEAVYTGFSSGTAHWWQVQFAAPIVVRRFETNVINGGAYYQNTVVEGSNDGTTWNALCTFVPGMVGTWYDNNGRQGADFDNEIAYTHYRLSFNYASSNNPWLSTVSLFTCNSTGGVGYNGFHLDFKDAADLGGDVSGNNNDWVPVSLSAEDVTADTPTNNYVTFNPLDAETSYSLSLSNGNRTISTITDAAGSTIRMFSGKWAFRVTVDNLGSATTAIGVTAGSVSPVNTSASGTAAYGSGGESKVNGASWTAYGAPYTTGDNIDVYVNCDDGEVSFYKNGVSQGTLAAAVPSAGWKISTTVNGGSGNAVMTIDCGQGGFVPEFGYKTLCTANLPAPAIKAPAKHMDVVQYTGTGAVLSVGGLGFQPDLVWIKGRDSGSPSNQNHVVSDVIRGPFAVLQTNTADSELGYGFQSFNSDGFTVTGNGVLNHPGLRYTAWCWKAGGAAVANTDGAVASTVSVNPTAGFSIVKYAASGTAGTVGHGLGAAPDFIILKGCSGSSATASNWPVYHSAQGAAKRGALNYTQTFDAQPFWNNTSPTASVFSLGSDPQVSGASTDYIAYCWTEIDGFSKFGSYVGNGSVDGPFVHCGFRPRWVMIKRTDDPAPWMIHDTQREIGNPTDAHLYPNLVNAEQDGLNNAWDILSNGFKLRSNFGDSNASGGTYIFAAFAEAPLGGLKTVPAKAR